MNSRKSFLFLSIIALTLSHGSAQQKPTGREMTLAQAREALVGKKVIVISSSFSQLKFIKRILIEVETGGPSGW
jgi:hypothetical protein